MSNQENQKTEINYNDAEITEILPSATMIDIVFPGDTNHHGTLFGGEGLANMDKAAFIAAARFGRQTFVTASCERVDFRKPALLGEIVEYDARLVRAGRRSLTVVIDMTSETLDGNERRLCTRGIFHMVAITDNKEFHLPPLNIAKGKEDSNILTMSDIVFATQANSFGSMFGGDALAFMTKAAFILATRKTGKITVLASSEKIDFKTPVPVGSIIDAYAKILKIGNSSIKIQTEMWCEHPLSGERTHTATAVFTMVAVGENGKPIPIK